MTSVTLLGPSWNFSSLPLLAKTHGINCTCRPWKHSVFYKKSGSLIGLFTIKYLSVYIYIYLIAKVFVSLRKVLSILNTTVLFQIVPCDFAQFQLGERVLSDICRVRSPPPSLLGIWVNGHWSERKSFNRLQRALAWLLNAFFVCCLFLCFFAHTDLI